MKPLTQRPAWKALQDHFQKVQGVHLRVQNRAPPLDAAIVPAPDNTAVDHEHGTDRDASFHLSGARLVDGGLEE